MTRHLYWRLVQDWIGKAWGSLYTTCMFFFGGTGFSPPSPLTREPPPLGLRHYYEPRFGSLFFIWIRAVSFVCSMASYLSLILLNKWNTTKGDHKILKNPLLQMRWLIKTIYYTYTMRGTDKNTQKKIYSLYAWVYSSIKMQRTHTDIFTWFFYYSQNKNVAFFFFQTK